MSEPGFLLIAAARKAREPRPGTCGACVSFDTAGWCTNRTATLGAVIQTGRDSTCNWFVESKPDATEPKP